MSPLTRALLKSDVERRGPCLECGAARKIKLDKLINTLPGGRELVAVSLICSKHPTPSTSFLGRRHEAHHQAWIGEIALDQFAELRPGQVISPELLYEDPWQKKA